MRDQSGTTNVTECPQAGLRGSNSNPLDKRSKDDTEKKGDGGSNIRVNQDYSCFPQDETALDQNPKATKNIVAGANDYRLGWGTSGFYASTDNGNHWYDGITPFPSLPSGDNLDGGGDPAIVFDRGGVVYYAQINFNRTDDTSGVWVNRSTNGGYTWTRPCVAIRLAPAPSEQAACGGAGDVRQPGDGTVGYIRDNDSSLNGSVPAFDKEWITAGPRPAGISPTCFTPIAHAATACDPASSAPTGSTSPTRCSRTTGSAEIFLSYSDDQARSWSPRSWSTGRSEFCVGPAASHGATTARAPSRRSTRPPVSSGSASSTATRPTRISTSSSRRRTAATRSRRRPASTRSTTSTSRVASTAARTASPAARARRGPCRRTAASASTRS